MVTVIKGVISAGGYKLADIQHKNYYSLLQLVSTDLEQ